jgi:hypothetical protein
MVLALPQPCGWRSFPCHLFPCHPPVVPIPVFSEQKPGPFQGFSSLFMGIQGYSRISSIKKNVGSGRFGQPDQAQG